MRVMTCTIFHILSKINTHTQVLYTSMVASKQKWMDLSLVSTTDRPMTWFRYKIIEPRSTRSSHSLFAPLVSIFSHAPSITNCHRHNIIIASVILAFHNTTIAMSPTKKQKTEDSPAHTELDAETLNSGAVG